MTRLPDWQARLERFITAHIHQPFAYGSWDCCLWVCSAIHEMTGIDPAEDFRGKYKSRDEAYILIKAVTGAKSLQMIVSKITANLKMAEVPILSAQRGDVVLLKRAKDYSLGLIALNGRHIVVCQSTGLRPVSLNHAVRAWRV